MKCVSQLVEEEIPQIKVVASMMSQASIALKENAQKNAFELKNANSQALSNSKLTQL